MKWTDTIDATFETAITCSGQAMVYGVSHFVDVRYRIQRRKLLADRTHPVAIVACVGGEQIGHHRQLTSKIECRGRTASSSAISCNAACYLSSLAARPYIDGSSFGPVADQTTRNGIGVCGLTARLSVPN